MIVDIVEEYEPMIVESENPPRLTEIDGRDGILFNTSLSDDRRIRQAVYDRLVAAKRNLPPHLTFMVFEAYRPRAKQIAMWNDIWAKVKESYPNADDEELALRCNTFIANPYKVGSGHQFGCAVDITLYDLTTGEVLDMGCGMQEFSDKSKTDCDGLTDLQRHNRHILRDALHGVGLVNYPPEWWHYSYGDRLWAIQLGLEKSVYGVLPF